MAISQHRLLAEEDGGEHHGGDHGDGVGLEEVGRHAGAIADIVADVVGDGRRVAGIVLGNAGFDLADEIGADIGTLGEDTAAETREDRDQRGAETEGDEGVDDLAAVGRRAHPHRKDVEVDGNAEQGETGDQHAGDGAGLERDIEAAGERQRGALRGPHVGAHRDVHADEPGDAGEERADEEADRDGPGQEETQHHEDHHADGGNRDVLTTKIGLGTLGDGAGDLLHAGGAGIGAQKLRGGDDAVDERQKTAEDDKPKTVHRVVSP